VIEIDQDTDATIRALIRRAMENKWDDSKNRDRLRSVMEDRMAALGRITGFYTIDSLKEGDRAQYNRFLDGCLRAFRRDGLISAGLLDKGQLLKLKDAELARRHHAETSDLHASFDDMSEERYP
jgi:hypothetical protein